MNAQDQLIVQSVAPALHVSAALAAAGTYVAVMYLGVKALSSMVNSK